MENYYYFCYFLVIEQVVIMALGSILVVSFEAENRHPILEKTILGYCKYFGPCCLARERLIIQKTKWTLSMP